MPFPEHSLRTGSPAQLLPTESAGSQLLSLKSLAPEYKVLGTRSLEAWAAAKAEIRGRGGLQWSNFRPPAALGPRRTGREVGARRQQVVPGRTPGEERDSRLLAATEVKGTETSASRQSGVWSGWSRGAPVAEEGAGRHTAAQSHPALQRSSRLRHTQSPPATPGLGPRHKDEYKYCLPPRASPAFSEHG